MSALQATHPTLAQTLWPSSVSKPLRILLMLLVGSLLLTMQTFAVLVLGMAFGWRVGMATVLLYIAQGALGLPVFAGTPEKGIGLAYIMGPTGGYLLGFVLAAGVCGWLAERGWDRTLGTTALAMLIGNIVIYAPGLLWLGSLFGWDKPILEWGLYPFLLGDVVKLALAAVAMPLAWKLLRRS